MGASSSPVDSLRLFEVIGCWTIGDAIHGPADVGQYSDHDWGQKVGGRSVAVEGYQTSDGMKISETEGS